MVGIHILTLQRLRGAQFPLVKEGRKKFRVMHHMEGTGVVVFEGVEGVGIGGDDSVELNLFQAFHVFLHEELEEAFLAHAADLMPRILFQRPEYAEIDPGPVECPNHVAGNGLAGRIIGAVAVDKKEDIHCVALLQFLYREIPAFLDPVGPLGRGFSKGVSCLFNVHEDLVEGLGVLRGLDQMASHIDDLVDIFDKDGAFGLTRPAGGARPDLIVRDDITHQGRAVFLWAGLSFPPKEGDRIKTLIPQLHGEHLGRQGPSHSVGGTVVRAAAAFRAGIEVEDMLPGKILDLFNPHAVELVNVLHIPPGRFDAPGGEPLEKNVGECRDDMEVFPQGKEVEKEEKGQDMEPVAPRMNPGEKMRIRSRQDPGGYLGGRKPA